LFWIAIVPFQLDGNIGSCAGMAEMLLQSHTCTLELLPALTEAWKNGKVNGLKAQGAYEVSMEWVEGKLIQARIKALKAGSCKINYQQNTISKELNAESVTIFCQFCCYFQVNIFSTQFHINQ